MLKILQASIFLIYSLILICKLDILSKLVVLLQPIQEDWEKLGLQLNMNQSVLTEINHNKDYTEKMKCLLERWLIEGGNLRELQVALLQLGKDEVITGMMYSQYYLVTLY